VHLTGRKRLGCGEFFYSLGMGVVCIAWRAGVLTFSWRGSLAWVVVGCAWKICAVLWLDLGICAAWVGGWMDGMVLSERKVGKKTKGGFFGWQW
jgi:hypothetical protein